MVYASPGRIFGLSLLKFLNEIGDIALLSPRAENPFRFLPVSLAHHSKQEAEISFGTTRARAYLAINTRRS
jgi:hypothetical protein